MTNESKNVSATMMFGTNNMTLPIEARVTHILGLVININSNTPLRCWWLEQQLASQLFRMS